MTRKTKEFRKDFKYSLGDKIRNECVDLVVLIYKANSTSDKAALIEKIIEKVNVVELLVRLSKDMHLMSIESYSEIVALTDSLLRQAAGWLRSQGNREAE